MTEQIERICISVNTKCNLKCKYCYFFNSKNAIEGINELTSDEIFLILENIHFYTKQCNIRKDLKVNFVGSGEPLLSWKSIKQALTKFKLFLNDKIKFYLVTNGTLISDIIADEMIDLGVFPSVSLDGFKEIHDKYRISAKGIGSFAQTMKGIEVLRSKNFTIAINTTVTKDIIMNIQEYFSFLVENNINKVTFDRMVDVNDNIQDVSYDEFYMFLINLLNVRKEMKLDNIIQIGNFESYKKNYSGNIDKVCTMFGSSCGAGTNFLIYILKDVYPCGRMFGKEEWKLGIYSDNIYELQNNMKNKIIKRKDCNTCNLLKYCYRDCIIDDKDNNYSCLSRQKFLNFFKQ